MTLSGIPALDSAFYATSQQPQPKAWELPNNADPMQAFGRFDDDDISLRGDGFCRWRSQMLLLYVHTRAGTHRTPHTHNHARIYPSIDVHVPYYIAITDQHTQPYAGGRCPGERLLSQGLRCIGRPQQHSEIR